MASSTKLFFTKPKYIYPQPDSFQNNDNAFEFNESDVYDLDHQLQPQKSKSNSISKLRRKPVKSTDLISDNRKIGKPGSLPVNIPDWSKILKSEYKKRVVPDDYYSDDDEEIEEDEDGYAIPPHEYVARRRGSSLSVHEGVVGGTPKGRDLTRLRDAIWEKTGFQD